MNPYVAVVLEQLLPVLSAVLTVVGVALARKAVQVFEARTGLDVSAQHEAMLDDMLRRAVARGEEYARGVVKAGEEKPDGAEKLDVALDFAEAEAQRLGLNVRGREHLENLLEAKLGLTR